MRTAARSLFFLVVLGGVAFLGWKIYGRLQEDEGGAGGRRGGAGHPAPVEVAEVRRGPIELRRTFTGTLEAPDELVISPKIPGRVQEIAVDLSDTVRRGQVVARLDNDEYLQAVAQAEADLKVARANLAQAKSALGIAERALERVQTLRERGISSESQLDVATAEQLAKQAAVEVAGAQVSRAESSLETARIRLAYTEIVANWKTGDDERIVAQRYVDEGGTVAANAPLLSILELDPITGVVYVPERDYALLSVGQAVDLASDAYHGETFRAKIDRIAQTFRRETRQARVELRTANADRRLKPGMFIRATVVLQRVEDAALMPAAALTKRDDRAGVFLVAEDGEHVAWRPLEIGIRDGETVQVLDDAFAGRVVTLGHQLIDDGSAIVIPDMDAPPAEPPE